MQPGGSDGRVVVITGASGGIGAGLARRLGQAGDRLVLAARREAELALVAAESGGALAVATDVTRRAEVERLRDAALAAFGRIDVWINNAGRGITRPALELTDDDVDDMVTVNVKSALYGMQAVDEVVDVLARVLEEPVAEAYTNPAQPGVVQRYLSDVAAFEAELGRGA